MSYIETKYRDPKYIAFANKMVGNITDAQDLLHEAILGCLKKEATIEEDKIGAYLYISIQHTSISNHRKHIVNSARKRAMQEMYTPVSPVSEAHLDLPAVLKFLETLPPKQSKPLLKSLGGYTYAEIAEQENCPIGTVMSRIATCRKRLEAQFPEYLN